MSELNGFVCEHCGECIVYGDGGYRNSCEHYPMSKMNRVVDGTQPDYRTRLMHEYAGRAMQGILANPATDNQVATDSIKYAKDLIAELGMDDPPENME